MKQLIKLLWPKKLGRWLPHLCEAITVYLHSQIYSKTFANYWPAQASVELHVKLTSSKLAVSLVTSAVAGTTNDILHAASNSLNCGGLHHFNFH